MIKQLFVRQYSIKLYNLAFELHLTLFRSILGRCFII